MENYFTAGEQNIKNAAYLKYQKLETLDLKENLMVLERRLIALKEKLSPFNDLIEKTEIEIKVIKYILWERS